jgi:hypothetical protein
MRWSAAHAIYSPGLAYSPFYILCEALGSDALTFENKE